MPLPRFCPECGGPVTPTRFGPAGQLLEGRCAPGGHVSYARSRPTAGVLIERDGAVLLVRRGVPPALGRWDIPGGFLEEGEEPESGARREIREELGVEVGPLRLVSTGINPHPEGAVLDIIYETSELAGKPRAMDDATGLGWFRPDSLPADLAFDATARILRRWRKTRDPAGALKLVEGPPEVVTPLASIQGPWSAFPPGWTAECGEWTLHDGWLCGRVAGEQPAALWCDTGVEGDHLIRFTAWTVPPHGNDINCYWEGSGRILAGPDPACTIGGVGGWRGNYTGIERHPGGVPRSVTGRAPVVAGRALEIIAGRRGRTDFLFLDGILAAQVDDAAAARRPCSHVAVATWNSHVHVSAVMVGGIR